MLGSADGVLLLVSGWTLASLEGVFNLLGGVFNLLGGVFNLLGGVFNLLALRGVSSNSLSVPRSCG